MTVVADWSYPTAIKFGAGRVKELPEHAAGLAIRRPLVVTDRDLAGLPIVEGVARSLLEARLDASVFAGVQPNPTHANLEAGVAAYRTGGHDGVIALGGGSSIDLGKLIAFAAGQTRAIWDFEDIGDRWMGADASRVAPIIAIPTTAGTGSEVGRAAVLTDTNARVKRVIFHPTMMPAIALCDPELTVSMPMRMTVGTGLDAFAHCLEAYCARGFHPMADGMALEGLRLVKEHLPRAVRSPADIEARGAMMAAATIGATAFQKGLGAIHALSHPIGALHDTHHGITNAVVMPAVLSANRPEIEAKIDRAASYLGLAGGFDGFLRFVCELRADLGVPETLVELGVPRASFEQIREMSLSDPTAAGNPLPLTRALATQMLEAAFGG